MSALQILGLVLVGGLVMYIVLYTLLRLLDGSLRPFGRDADDAPVGGRRRVTAEDGALEIGDRDLASPPDAPLRGSRLDECLWPSGDAPRRHVRDRPIARRP